MNRNPFVVTRDPATGVVSLQGLGPDTWALTQEDARRLREALLLALDPVGPAPHLGCRITSARKACRGCGAETSQGQAHNENCPDLLRPEGFVEADVDPPTPEEKAAGERAPLVVPVAQYHDETVYALAPGVTPESALATLEAGIAAEAKGKRCPTCDAGLGEPHWRACPEFKWKG